jgi:hypothetical protein
MLRPPSSADVRKDASISEREVRTEATGRGAGMMVLCSQQSLRARSGDAIDVTTIRMYLNRSS